jgi:hypothetical protein
MDKVAQAGHMAAHLTIAMAQERVPMTDTGALSLQDGRYNF